MARLRGEPLRSHFKDNAAGITVLLVVEAAIPLVFAAGAFDRLAGLVVVLNVKADMVQPHEILAEAFAGVVVGLELDDGDVHHAIGEIDSRCPDMVRIDFANLPHAERLDIEVCRLPRISGSDPKMTQFTGHRRSPQLARASRAGG